MLNWSVKLIVRLNESQYTTNTNSIIIINQYCEGPKAAKHWQKLKWLFHFIFEVYQAVFKFL